MGAVSVIHDSLTGPDAIHPAAFVSATDPAGTPANQVGPYKIWIDSSVAGAYVVKVRNAANDAWVVVTANDHGQLAGLTDDDHPQYAKLTLVDAKGDLLVGTAADTLARVAVGLTGEVLTADPAATAGVAWAAPPAALTNPMTTPQDIIVGGTSGAPTRLAKGTNGYVLGVNGSGVLEWMAQTGGMANPMTTPQDLIVGGTAGAPGRLGVGTDGDVLTVVAGALAWQAPVPPEPEPEFGAIEFTFGDGATAITTSEPVQWVEIPWDATIVRATLIADASGSIVLDVQVTDYAGWPADAGDSICASAKPTLASSIKSQDSTLTGWDVDLLKGRYMRVVVDSASVCKRVVLSLALEGVPAP